MATIEATKVALRKTMVDRIAALSTEEKTRQSNIVYKFLINLPAFQTSSRVSIYLSTKDEVDTEPIVRKIFENNKKCFVPRYSKAGMQMVRLKDMQDWEDLPLTKWNIKQPALKEEREDALETGGLDLIICPGVAFTKNGHRLGHGGGYYDAFLTNLKKNQKQPPKTIGLGLNVQIIDEIPLTDKDVVIDKVVFAE